MREHVEPNCGRQDILQNEAARSWLHWERGLLIVFAFVGPGLYALTAIGLFYRVRFAGFLAWFIFIGPGVAEFTQTSHRSGESAKSVAPVSKRCFDLSPAQLLCPHTYYFAGMYTAILPMIPGIYGIYRILQKNRRRKALVVREDQETSEMPLAGLR